MKNITPAGYQWIPVPPPYEECPCGINRHDCDYHKPDMKRKPIAVTKLTTIAIDGKEYFPGKVYKSVEIPLNNFGPSIDFVIKP